MPLAPCCWHKKIWWPAASVLRLARRPATVRDTHAQPVVKTKRQKMGVSDKMPGVGLETTTNDNYAPTVH